VTSLAVFTPETPLDWQRWAACQWTDLDLMFPEQGGDVTAAKRVCRSCPVREECLAYALANEEQFGVWGGLTAREMRSTRHRPRPLADVIAASDARHRRNQARIDAMRKNPKGLAA
jgi:adenine-specific DNA glycosylase